MKKNSILIAIAFVLSSCLLVNANAKGLNCKSISSYENVKKSDSCIDGEVHHLIEKRFAACLNVNPDLIPSICLSKEKHRIYTNLWRDKIQYTPKDAEYNCTKIVSQILISIFTIYSDDPCVVRNLLEWFSKNSSNTVQNALRQAFQKINKFPKIIPKNTLELATIPFILREYYCDYLSDNPTIYSRERLEEINFYNLTEEKQKCILVSACYSYTQACLGCPIPTLEEISERCQNPDRIGLKNRKNYDEFKSTIYEYFKKLIE